MKDQEEYQPLRNILSKERMIFVITGVMLSMLLSSLDQTIVGTSMPRIIADLNGLNHYAWVFTAYMLTSTVSVPIYGKLSDIYGRRPFYLLGMLLFLLGSALSGTSQTIIQLILFRGVQGLGAGAMMPIVIAIIGDIFPPAQRGKWQGLMMSVFGLATIVGPTMGGWITDNLGWRWVFYVNMPVGILALLVVFFSLPKQNRYKKHVIDFIGALYLIGATVPMLLAFSWAGTQYDWLSIQIIGLLVFSACMYVIFFLIEFVTPEPIINPSFFKNEIFSISVITTFLASVGMFGAIMYLPLFIQGVIGKSATNSGTVLTPMMLGFIVSSIIGGQILSRTGRYKLLAVAAFIIAGIGTFLLSQMNIDTSEGTIIRNMIITGLGMGTTMSLFTIIVQNSFKANVLGQATANLQFFRSIGGTIGVAILGSVMTNSFQSNLQASMPKALKAISMHQSMQTIQNPQVLLDPQVVSTMQKQFAAFGPSGLGLFNQLLFAIRTSLATAITHLFIVSTIAMGLACISVLFLKEIPLRKTTE